MAATDARPVPRKNAAFRFYFAIRKPSDGTLITTWTGADSEVSLDGAAFSDCTNEATEIGTTGCGYLDLTSSEMNADAVVLKITVTNTGAVPLVYTFFPEEAGDYRADATHWGGTAVASANVRADLINIAGVAVNTASAQIGVNVVNAAGTAWNSGAIGASTIATDAITAAKIAANAFDAATFASDVPAAFRTWIGLAAADLDSQLAAIVSDTNELQTDWANGGRLDLLVDGIKAKTENLPSDPADQSLIIDATNALATLIGDVPTNAEAAALFNAIPAAVRDVNNTSPAANSLGAAVNNAGGGGGGGDPWSTALPGAYAPGTAGNIVGNLQSNLVASLSATTISVTGPVITEGDPLTIAQGADYQQVGGDDQRISITVSGTGVGSLDGDSWSLILNTRGAEPQELEGAASTVDADTLSIKFAATAEQTGTLRATDGAYQIKRVPNGTEYDYRPKKGSLIVVRDESVQRT